MTNIKKQKKEVFLLFGVLILLMGVFIVVSYMDEGLSKKNFKNCVNAQNESKEARFILDTTGNYSSLQLSLILKAIENKCKSLDPFTKIYLYLLGDIDNTKYSNLIYKLEQNWCFFGDVDDKHAKFAKKFYKKRYQKLINIIKSKVEGYNPSLKDKAGISPILEAIRYVSNDCNSSIPSEIILISDLIQTSKKSNNSLKLILKGSEKVVMSRISSFINSTILLEYKKSLNIENKLSIYGIYRATTYGTQSKYLFPFFQNIFRDYLINGKIVEIDGRKK